MLLNTDTNVELIVVCFCFVMACRVVLATADELEEFREHHSILAQASLTAAILSPISMTTAVTLAGGLNNVGEAVVKTTFFGRVQAYNGLWEAIRADDVRAKGVRSTGLKSDAQIHSQATNQICITWRKTKSDKEVEDKCALIPQPSILCTAVHRICSMHFHVQRSSLTV